MTSVVTSSISRYSKCKTQFCARLLPLTRHYHQYAETFWMGKDTGEAEKNEPMSKQTAHETISQIHTQEKRHIKTCF